MTSSLLSTYSLRLSPLSKTFLTRALCTATVDAPRPLSRMELTFEDYVVKRRKLRLVKRLSGIPLAFAGLTASSMLHLYWNPHMFDATSIDQIQLIYGMDPLMIASLSGIAAGGVSYLIGGFIYEKSWHLFNKDLATKMNQRNADFLSRIQAHRSSDFSKFEDDYYGESIRSLSDYRQWIRTQQRKKKDAEKSQQQKEEESNKETDKPSKHNFSLK
eukprot:m.15231 g.15231  ORF g.15231 m.15231 type:complete len:216 (+) comp26251_c0_seq1:23-670(+)